MWFVVTREAAKLEVVRNVNGKGAALVPL